MKRSLPPVFIVVCLLSSWVGAWQSDRDRGSRKDRPATGEAGRPLLLTGQVITSDGSGLPHPLRVLLTCRGRVTSEAYADAEGFFSIQLGGRGAQEIPTGYAGGVGGAPSGRPDASRSASLGMPGTMDRLAARERVNLSGCRLTAEANGFQSSLIELGVRRVLDDPDVGAITVSRVDDHSGSVVTVNSLATPPKAMKAFNRALRMLEAKQPRPAAAARALEKAVRIHPEFAQAWRLLGRLKRADGDLQGAREALEEAVAADPGLVESYLDLAQVLADGRLWQDSLEVAGGAQELFPDDPRVLYACAVAHFNLKNFEEAEAAAMRLGPAGDRNDFAGVHYVLGVILASRGDLPGAVRELELFLTLEPSTPAADRVREQLAIWGRKGLLPDGSP